MDRELLSAKFPPFHHLRIKSCFHQGGVRDPLGWRVGAAGLGCGPDFKAQAMPSTLLLDPGEPSAFCPPSLLSTCGDPPGPPCLAGARESDPAHTLRASSLVELFRCSWEPRKKWVISVSALGSMYSHLRP